MGSTKRTPETTFNTMFDFNNTDNQNLALVKLNKKFLSIKPAQSGKS